ncbi:lysophospholipid acyltransferase family protein [Brevibacillus choshinensis]|uniref:1-acyl-sn-glycerol-3-phosphate acyltransferase n=1 Tax=Brevibacillus choshinensis TaxID=54911 RepID=A0ABX7FUF0_BRECH|nr:lysophospholipid acyltransferase family protein [Brevibacillus choshinensis]QRG69888.1 1-acyl-sn-glycerol-3-phosphate acyltransferase [Brevibacillus choshinensis]
MSYYRTFRGFFRIIFSLVYRWQVIGREHIPKEGPVILCANHISLWDPPLLGSGIERMVHFMAKEELFRIPVIGFLITKFGAFPVKRGAGDRAAIRTTLKVLEEGKILGIFPEGTRSKTGEVGEGMPGVAMFALKSQAQVIPVAIIGPYRMFRPIKIVYGKPIDLTALREAKSSGDTLKETTNLIMTHIKALRDHHRS